MQSNIIGFLELVVAVLIVDMGGGSWCCEKEGREAANQNPAEEGMEKTVEERWKN